MMKNLITEITVDLRCYTLWQYNYYLSTSSPIVFEKLIFLFKIMSWRTKEFILIFFREIIFNNFILCLLFVYIYGFLSHLGNTYTVNALVYLPYFVAKGIVFFNSVSRIFSLYYFSYACCRHPSKEDFPAERRYLHLFRGQCWRHR